MKLTFELVQHGLRTQIGTHLRLSRICKYKHIQLTEYEVGRFALYEVKPGILRKAFWVLKLELLL